MMFIMHWCLGDAYTFSILDGVLEWLISKSKEVIWDSMVIYTHSVQSLHVIPVILEESEV